MHQVPGTTTADHSAVSGSSDEPGADTDDTVRRLAEMLGRFRTLAAEATERMGTALDLPVGQVAVLLAVDAGATNVSGVAHQCLTHLSNASRTVDALVQADLLDRETDPDDRRSVRLSVTTAGRERIRRIHRHRDVVMARALADIDRVGQARLVDLVGRLVTSLEELVTHPDLFDDLDNLDDVDDAPN